MAFTVERVRIDEKADHSLVSGADDEEEPAGYFIVEINAAGATPEFLGDELGQRDGVLSLEIGETLLAFPLDPTSPIGAWMPHIRVTSREPIGPAERKALTRVSGGAGPRGMSRFRSATVFWVRGLRNGAVRIGAVHVKGETGSQFFETESACQACGWRSRPVARQRVRTVVGKELIC